MRSTLMTLGATALLAGTMSTGFATPGHAQSGAFGLQIQLFEAPRILGEPVPYADPKPREVEPRDWERRRGDREARDQARIEEAARREAQRIEEERDERRAWRRANRENRGGEYRGGENRGDDRFEELRERYRRD